MNPYAPKRLALALVAALAPLIMAFSVFIANEAQALFDMRLKGPALAGYISAFLLAVAVALFRLLEHEAARILHAVAKVLMSTPPTPKAPPGPPAEHSAPSPRPTAVVAAPSSVPVGPTPPEPGT